MIKNLSPLLIRELDQVDEVIGGVYQLIIWLYLPSIIVIIIETMVVSFL